MVATCSHPAFTRNFGGKCLVILFITWICLLGRSNSTSTNESFSSTYEPTWEATYPSHPSSTPAIEPTLEPTQEPSADPTATPTTSPTIFPTASPVFDTWDIMATTFYGDGYPVFQDGSISTPITVALDHNLQYVYAR